MNKVGLLFRELHEAETDLARELRAVAERQTVDAGTHYPCLTLARQCDAHAELVRRLAERHGVELSEPRRPEAVASAVGAVRRKTSEMLGRRPVSGLLLLRDLRELFLMAQAVNVHWIMVGQLAQALREQELLAQASTAHQQTLTQIKWLKTRLKDASPQLLAVPD